MGTESKKPVTVIKKDALDSLMFEGVKRARKISELCSEPGSEGLTQDCFSAFYTHSPEIEANAPAAQKGMMEALLSLPEFKALRAGTQNDEIASALGAVSYAPEMIQKLQEVEKKLEEKREQAKKAGKPAPQSLQEALGDGEMATLRQGMRRALGEAQEKTDEYSEAVASWGLDAGELASVPFEQRFELAERLTNSTKLKNISDLVGRFKNIVNSAAAAVQVHGQDEIVDIGISSDIAHLVPSEFVKMEETPDLFFSDFLEGKLLTYNLKGNEDLGKGPIIACMDISGSMDGQREEWAKAVILALMHLAEKQKRAFGFIAFESSVRVRKFWPKAAPASIQDKMDIASVVTNGGTDFVSPLLASFDLRAKEPTLKPADVVFITDGSSDIPEHRLKEILELKAKTEVRIYSIMVCSSSEYELSVLKSFSDQVSSVNSLGEIDVVADLVNKTAADVMGRK